jgi:hypothetical protein
MAGAGVMLRKLREWMGHRDFKTMLIYADYQPAEREAELVERPSAPVGARLASTCWRPRTGFVVIEFN